MELNIPNSRNLGVLYTSAYPVRAYRRDDVNPINVVPNMDKNNEVTDEDSIPPPGSCWMTLNADKYFKKLDEIDSRYSKMRQEVQEAVKENHFDTSMVQGFIRERGVALREVNHKKRWMIPSGLNLAGFSMMRMPESIIFFHRMKLRNNTYFRVNYLHNDLYKMTVTIQLSLNDLHLQGAYERSLTEANPSILIYSPTFGEVEFLLKNVDYKIEGRYRLIKNRLLIELVSSEIFVDDVLMTYINQVMESAAIRISKENLGSFLAKLKKDLDKWIKDYFNDYMIYAPIDALPNINKLAKYDKEKGSALEEFTDYALRAIKTRIRVLDAESIRLPMFTFKSINGVQIKLFDGVLNGLDSIYRRSVATGYKEGDIRKVDCKIGFSSLKVIYKYEAMIPSGVPPVPPLSGALTLLANDLTAHMALAMVSEPETIDLDLEFLDEQIKPESLTIEGAANTMIANFKHLLEHQIVAVMSNTLYNGVTMLKSLPRCEPFIPGQIVNKQVLSYQHSLMYDLYQDDDDDDDEDSYDTHHEKILRGNGKSQRRPAKHPKSLKKQSSKMRKFKKNKKIDKKKNQRELNKNKRRNKRKQEVNKL